MQQKPKSRFIQIGTLFVVACSILLSPQVNNAQIIQDQTLPNNSTITTNNNLIEITGGTQAGTNLFHSFKEFSLQAGNVAYFNNNLAIQNIFSRVTGGTASYINGLIQANGTANLFFLNPSGIIFGSNAALNLGGSFLATTANSINFIDGTKFGVGGSKEVPLLTVNVPIGLDFNNSTPIQIYNQGHNLATSSFPILGFPRAGLQLSSSKTLAIIGGNVTLDGGILSALNGRIELGAVRSGLVIFNFSDTGLILDYQAANTFGDIQLINQSLLNVFGFSPKSIQIQGSNVSFKDGSLVRIQNVGSQSYSTLGIHATDSLKVGNLASDQSAPSRLITETIGSADGGNVEIVTPKLLIENGSINTLSYSSGQGGNLMINAPQSIKLEGTPPYRFLSFIGISTSTFGQGQSGNINLSTQQLTVNTGAAISTSTFSQGQSGSINLSTQYLTVTDGGGIAATSLGQGQGGDVNLSTQQLTVTDGGGIVASTFNSAPGGNLKIKASDSVEVSGFSLSPSTTSSIFPNAENFPSTVGTFTVNSGNAGSIEIISKNLRLNNGGTVGTATFGQGWGGDVRVNSKTVELSGATPGNSPSLINSATYNFGNAGNILVNATELKLLNGGAITSSTYAAGNAGKIVINTSDSVEVSGFTSLSFSLIDSSATILPEEARVILGLPPVPSGRSGDIAITSKHLTVSDGGSINVNNEGIERGGSIQINTPVISLDQGSITASTQSGEGGDITISSKDIRLLDSSEISATAGGTGNGGNINIDTDTLALLNSNITANAFEGQGGNINIAGQGFLASLDSSITASSQFGSEGIIQLNIDPFQIISADTGLPVNESSLEDLLTQTCSILSKRRDRFTVRGTGGVGTGQVSGYTLEDLAPSGQVFGFIKKKDGTVRLLSCDSLDGIDAEISKRNTDE